MENRRIFGVSGCTRRGKFLWVSRVENPRRSQAGLLCHGRQRNPESRSGSFYLGNSTNFMLVSTQAPWIFAVQRDLEDNDLITSVFDQIIYEPMPEEVPGLTEVAQFQLEESSRENSSCPCEGSISEPDHDDALLKVSSQWSMINKQLVNSHRRFLKWKIPSSTNRTVSNSSSISPGLCDPPGPQGSEEMIPLGCSKTFVHKYFLLCGLRPHFLIVLRLVS